MILIDSGSSSEGRLIDSGDSDDKKRLRLVSKVWLSENSKLTSKRPTAPVQIVSLPSVFPQLQEFSLDDISSISDDISSEEELTATYFSINPNSLHYNNTATKMANSSSGGTGGISANNPTLNLNASTTNTTASNSVQISPSFKAPAKGTWRKTGVYEAEAIQRALNPGVRQRALLDHEGDNSDMKGGDREETSENTEGKDDEHASDSQRDTPISTEAKGDVAEGTNEDDELAEEQNMVREVQNEEIESRGVGIGLTRSRSGRTREVRTELKNKRPVVWEDRNTNAEKAEIRKEKPEFKETEGKVQENTGTGGVKVVEKKEVSEAKELKESKEPTDGEQNQDDKETQKLEGSLANSRGSEDILIIPVSKKDSSENLNRPQQRRVPSLLSRGNSLIARTREISPVQGPLSARVRAVSRR